MVLSQRPLQLLEAYRQGYLLSPYIYIFMWVTLFRAVSRTGISNLISFPKVGPWVDRESIQFADDLFILAIHRSLTSLKGYPGSV